ncbi:hypothetical protein C8F01DRAFT_1375685 [Mycena amicta]|nr:hypothetical protein C8F01DRAFT_1375685 [Mycena amicta]
MSQDTKASSHPLYTILDTSLPMSRRLSALGALSGTFGLASSTIGAIGGAIPRCRGGGEFSSAHQPHPTIPTNLPRCTRQRSPLRPHWRYRQSRALPSARIWLASRRRPYTPDSQSTLHIGFARWWPRNATDVAAAETFRTDLAD